MSTILISDYQSYKETLHEFKKDGADSLAVIADFDRTITSSKYNAMMSVLEDILQPAYKEDAQRLFDTYYPIERNPHIPDEEKYRAMEAWWRETFALWRKHGLTKQHIVDIVEKTDFSLRGYVKEFFDTLDQRNIPSVILSASGLGVEGIHVAMNKYSVAMAKVLAFSNELNWDGNTLVGPKGKIVHSANKTTVAKEDPTVAAHLAERPNLIIAGDSLHDSLMASIVPHKRVLRVGFMEDNIYTHLDEFRKKFDVVLFGNADFSYITSVIEDICTVKFHKSF